MKQNEIIVSRAGTSVNMEGAVPTEQEINQPKPSKRARTSFTADQLQVSDAFRRVIVQVAVILFVLYLFCFVF